MKNPARFAVHLLILLLSGFATGLNQAAAAQPRSVTFQTRTMGTVASLTQATADAWATAFIVMDAWRARQIARDHDELHVVLIEQASAAMQVIWVEEFLRENFAVPESRVESVTVRYF